MKSTDQVENIETETKPKRSPDKNFLNAGKRTIDDLVVNEYSPSRRVAAQAMTLHFGYVDNAGMELLSRTKLYPGAVNDVAVVMWLCCKATEDEIDSARVSPKKAASEAIAWAASKGLDNTRSELFWKAYTIFWDIMDEIEQAKFDPQKKTTASTATKK